MMAMPWSRAKAIRAEYLNGTRDVKKLTALFDVVYDSINAVTGN